MAISRDSPPQIPSVPPSHTRSSFKTQIWEWKHRILVTDTLLWGSYSLCLTLQCGSTDEGNPETPSARLPPSPPVAGPVTTLGGRGDVARFKSACPWFPGGSNLALVRIACGFLAHLSLFPWQKPWCDSHLSRSSIPLPFCCCDKCHDRKCLLEVGNRRQRLQHIIEGQQGRNGTEIGSLSRKHGGTLLALSDAGRVHLLREWHGPQQSGSSYIN